MRDRERRRKKKNRERFLTGFGEDRYTGDYDISTHVEGAEGLTMILYNYFHCTIDYEFVT